MAIKPTEKMRSIFETNLQKKKKKGTKRSMETQTWNPNTHLKLKANQ